jgi:hypothetical protein
LKERTLYYRVFVQYSLSQMHKYTRRCVRVREIQRERERERERERHRKGDIVRESVMPGNRKK